MCHADGEANVEQFVQHESNDWTLELVETMVGDATALLAAIHDTGAVGAWYEIACGFDAAIVAAFVLQSFSQHGAVWRIDRYHIAHLQVLGGHHISAVLCVLPQLQTVGDERNFRVGRFAQYRLDGTPRVVVFALLFDACQCFGSTFVQFLTQPL